MKKRVISIILALCLCLSMIPVGMIQASADVDEGGSAQQMPVPQNVQASFIGFKEVNLNKVVVVEISWDAIAEADGGNKYIEM